LAGYSAVLMAPSWVVQLVVELADLSAAQMAEWMVASTAARSADPLADWKVVRWAA
jgi:hypothetical protein